MCNFLIILNFLQELTVIGNELRKRMEHETKEIERLSVSQGLSDSLLCIKKQSEQFSKKCRTLYCQR